MDYKYLFKIIIIGDANIGKSCLLLRFINNSYRDHHDLTIGVEFGCKIIKSHDKDNIKLQIWDTAGQEAFKSIIRAYYRNTAGALLVYDVTNRNTFNNVKVWLDDIQKYSTNNINSIILVGNKIDLENREISFEEGFNLASNYNLLFIETSAKTCENIDLVFEILTKDILSKLDVNNINCNGIKINNNNNTINNNLNQCCKI